MTRRTITVLVATAALVVWVTACGAKPEGKANEALGRHVLEVVRLGMSEAEVSGALSAGFVLQDFESQVPKETFAFGRRVRVTYHESHGRHYSVTHAVAGRYPLAWLTFEAGKLTRIHRTLAGFSGLRSDEFVKALADSLERMGAQNPSAAKVQVFSWKNQFRMLEFDFGQRQVEVRVFGDDVSLSENFGRGDVEDNAPGP